MRENGLKNIEFELTTPEKEVIFVQMNPEELFTYQSKLSKPSTLTNT